MSEHKDKTTSPEAAPSEVRSSEIREGVRNQLAADVEAFLAQGGNIEEVPRDYRADPPRRPESSYGRGSI